MEKKTPPRIIASTGVGVYHILCQSACPHCLYIPLYGLLLLFLLLLLLLALFKPPWPFEEVEVTMRPLFHPAGGHSDPPLWFFIILSEAHLSVSINNMPLRDAPFFPHFTPLLYYLRYLLLVFLRFALTFQQTRTTRLLVV